MRRLSLLAPFLLGLCAPLAHADTLQSFSLSLPNTSLAFLNGDPYGSATLDGSAIIDTTTGVVQSAGVFGESANLSFNATTITYQGTSNPNTPPPPHGGGGGCNDGCIFLQPYGSYYVALSDPATKATFTLQFASNSLVNYLGSDICTGGCSLSGKVSRVFDLAGDSTIVTVKGTTFRGSATLNTPSPDPGIPIAVDPIPGPAPFNPPLPDPTPDPSPTAVTPEPSTLCLLGTGLLTAAGTLRRRLRA